jgi:hypothetical protein
MADDVAELASEPAVRVVDAEVADDVHDALPSRGEGMRLGPKGRVRRCITRGPRGDPARG